MPEQLKQLGLTPAKAGIIGALVLVFAAVWGPQLAPLVLGSRGRAPKPRPKPRAAVQSPARAAAKPPASVAKTPVTATQPDTAPSGSVKVYSLSQASRYDPFAVPAWAPEPRRPSTPVRSAETVPSEAEQEARIAELKQTGVGMVLVSAGGGAAAIGDRLVHVGDEIEGFRVVKITTTGVLLEPAERPEESRGL